MADSVGKGFPTTRLQIGHIFCNIDDLTLWEYLGGVPASVASWKLIQGQVGTQPDTSLWGLPQAGARWFYTGEQTFYGWDGAQIVPIAFRYSPSLYDARRMFTMQDDFLSGLASSGAVGALGWVVTAGSFAIIASEADRPGLYRFNTSAVSGTQARLSGQNSSGFNPHTEHQVTWMIRCNTPDANTTMRVGAASSVAGNPPNNGIFFQKLAADTNWFGTVYESAVLVHRIDTRVPVDASFVRLRYHRLESGIVNFYINGQLVATTPVAVSGMNAFIAPYSFIINTAAADKSFDVDYAQMISFGTQR